MLASSRKQLVEAYRRIHPDADEQTVQALLAGRAREFLLDGVDLMPVQGPLGIEFRVLEVNSAPGFAYCTPGLDARELAYERLVSLLLAHTADDERDGLALLTESIIPMETEGLAACLGEAIGRAAPVLDPESLGRLRWIPRGDQRQARLADGRWLTGGLRYLHDAPWRFLPPDAYGSFVNGTRLDLRGGRDKVSAHLAFDAFEQVMIGSGVRVRCPRTEICWPDDDLEDVRRHFGAHVVIKIPDGNSGRGVDFVPHTSALGGRRTRPLVVQEALLPEPLADGGTPLHLAHHAGASYVFDLRVVVASDARGFAPLMLYGRRARKPVHGLTANLASTTLDDLLKVNISVPGRHGHVLETERLLISDDDGLDAMGLSATDLRAAIVEAIIATVAVDHHGCSWRS